MLRHNKNLNLNNKSFVIVRNFDVNLLFALKPSYSAMEMVVDDKRACCVIIKIKIYKNKFSKLVIIRKMDTDEESCFSDEEGALFEDSVKPYRFEPKYSGNEHQVMTHANNAMIESSSTPVDIS